MSNIWIYLGPLMFFGFYLTAFIIADRLNHKVFTNKGKGIAISAFYTFIMVVLYSFRVPYQLMYLIFAFIQLFELRFIHKYVKKQSVFLTTSMILNTFSFHTGVIIISSYMRELTPLEYLDNPYYFFYSVFVAYTMLTITLQIVMRFVPEQELNKLSQASGYSEIVSSMSIGLIVYIAIDSTFIVVDHMHIEFLVTTISSLLLMAVIFYSLFLFSSNLVNMHQYKRKTDEAKEKYKKLVDKKKQVQEKLHTDSLTKLYNKNFAYGKLEEMIEAGEKNYGVLYMDLVSLKNVNDILGHKVGDSYILTVAKAISTTIREDDVAARIGGDEFLVILNLEEENQMYMIVERIKAKISTQAKKEDFIMHANIGGIFIGEENTLTRSEILDKVDMLMRLDKERFYQRLER